MQGLVHVMQAALEMDKAVVNRPENGAFCGTEDMEAEAAAALLDDAGFDTAAGNLRTHGQAANGLIFLRFLRDPNY